MPAEAELLAWGRAALAQQAFSRLCAAAQGTICQAD